MERKNVGGLAFSLCWTTNSYSNKDDIKIFREHFKMTRDLRKDLEKRKKKKKKHEKRKIIIYYRLSLSETDQIWSGIF